MKFRILFVLTTTILLACAPANPPAERTAAPTPRESEPAAAPDRPTVADAPVDAVEGSRVMGIISSDTAGCPLAYANVILVGTSMGAMSLADGRFCIDNVPPGDYLVKVMMMGYKAQEYPITVTPDADIHLDFRMEETIVLKTQEIVVIADKPMIDVTSSEMRSSVSSEQLEEMPVDDALSGVALKGRTAKPGDKMHVRGGRSSDRRRRVTKGHVQTPYDAAHPRARSTRPVVRLHPRPGERPRPYPGTEEYGLVEESGFNDVLDVPSSTFSIDVDAASYASARRFVREGRLPSPNVVRIEEFINYFTYDYPDPTDEHPFSVVAEVADCPWNADNQLVHIGLQGKRLKLDDVPPSNLVFLLDVSGSMEPADKLPLLKKAFRMLTKNLRVEDRVSIVTYSSVARVELTPTAGNRKHRILCAIDRLHAGGSTAGAAGLRLAYEVAEAGFLSDGNNRVILATDGDFNVGPSSDPEMVQLIEHKRKSGIFLTVLGLGTGNIKDNKLELLADKGNGHYAYIDNILEAKKVLVRELGATLLTIAKDVKIQVEFNPAKVKAYRLIGYENRALAREDFKDDTKDAGELGAGHSVTALYEIVPAGEKVSGAGASDYKYTHIGATAEALSSPEILTIQLRYKAPDRDDSVEMERTVLVTDATDFARASGDFRFAAAVAEVGLMLRDSSFKGGADFDHAIEVAKSARGDDGEGHRAEFIRLAEQMQLLAEPSR